jgi:uncharacterized protein YifE (UPF0438 family)
MKYIPFSQLTTDEKRLLNKYYNFYRSLDTGERKPTTKWQNHFVNVCRGELKPKTKHEEVYLKYIGLLKDDNAAHNKAKSIDQKKKTKKVVYVNLKSAERRKREEEGQKLLSRIQWERETKKGEAAVKTKNKKMLKEQKEAVAKRVLIKKNVRDALIIHSDEDD